jgi:hypothetical protein
MGLSRHAMPSFHALAAGVHINGWVHTDIGIQYSPNILEKSMSHESTKRITEAMMGPSRRAMPSFQASAAGVHVMGGSIQT